MVQYYVQRDGQLYGPLGAKELRQAAKDGRVLPDDDLSTSPEGPWHEAKSIASLFSDETLRAYRESKKQPPSESEYDYSEMLDSAPDAFQTAPEPVLENGPDQDQPQDALMSAVSEEEHAPSEPPPLNSSATLKRKPKLTKCPDCLEMISKRAKRCPHCGCLPDWIEDKKPKYPALYAISRVYHYLFLLCLGLAGVCLVGFFIGITELMFTADPEFYLFNPVTSFLGMLTSLWSSITFKAISEILRLLIDVEQNSRQ